MSAIRFIALFVALLLNGCYAYVTAPEPIGEHELYPGETIKTSGYALASLAMFECALPTLRPNTRVRSYTWRYHATGEAGKNSILLSLVKSALRLITGYIGRTARADYQIPTPIVLIGIRGYAAAEPLYERSLAIREKTLGPNHPDVAASLNNLAALYQAEGQYAAAEPLYTRALAINEKARGPDHPDVATLLENISALYTNMGKTDEAEKLTDRAAKIRELKR